MPKAVILQQQTTA